MIVIARDLNIKQAGGAQLSNGRKAGAASVSMVAAKLGQRPRTSSSVAQAENCRRVNLLIIDSRIPRLYHVIVHKKPRRRNGF